MSRDEIEAREKILSAVIELIQQHHGDAAKITIRDIAAKAGVGIGLINYHFQTKENLINHSIQRMISRVIDRFEPLYKGLDMQPLDKLRFLLKSTAAFLVSEPGISRISILTDLTSGNSGDNSIQTFKVYFPVVKEVCGDKKTDEELSIILHLLISSIQVAFLRRDVLKGTKGIDFYDKEQREAFVDSVIDCIFLQK